MGKAVSPKRYYRRAERFAPGIDRLDIPANLPVTDCAIERWVDDLFRGGGMKALVGYMILRHGAWGEAMNLASSTTRPIVAFRAAWALEWAYEQSRPEDLPEWFFERLVGDFVASRNGSVDRIYAKMIVDAVRFGGMQLTDNQVDMLAERCFDLAIASATKSATWLWCLELLAEISPRARWVAEELPDLVRRISEAPDCTPAMRAGTRSLLARI